jgi:long-chain acyl-CoA synthetase
MADQVRQRRQAGPGVEVKIADNGEILVRGPMLLKEYYKRPDATAEAINADGYFMTGDAGCSTTTAI